MHDLFLSYARADDEPFVRRLYDALITEGVTVWYDREAMPNRGLNFSENIKRAVLDSKRLALIVGPHALTSEYVTKEWKTAESACIPVIPLMRLSDYKDLPPELAGVDAPDFRDDVKFDHWLNYLLRQIADDVPPPGNVHGLRFQHPRGYILRGALWTELDKAVRGDSLSAGVATSREQITALQGMGGIGKTTLAAAYVTGCAVRRTFDSGIFWLTAGRAAEVITLLTQLGEALGDDAKEYKNREIAISRLTRLLASCRALIILDDVWERDLVESFRETLSEHCRMLFTTRNVRLVTLTQAQRVRVDTLTVDDGVRQIGRWLNRPPQDDAAVRNPYLSSEKAIVEILDGHTLALTLAAARLDEIGVGYAPTLLAEYQRARNSHNPFSDLELDPDDKNFNVELSLRFSYDALSEDGRSRFRMLGVVAENSTFSREMAAAVWELQDAKASLTELANGALIEPEPSGRYSQHNVLRAYAHALLIREKDLDTTFGRYADRVTAESEPFKADKPEEWHAFEADLAPHLLEVGDELGRRMNAVPSAPLPDLGCEDTLTARVLAFALNTRLYLFRRREVRRIDWLEMGLLAARALADQRREALFLSDLALNWSDLGEKRRALEYSEQALKLAHAISDRDGEATALNNMGEIWRTLGEPRKALDYLEEGLALNRELGDQGREATALTNIGATWLNLGEPRKALDYFERALPLLHAIGDKYGESTTLNNIGATWSELGEERRALEYYDKALQLHCVIGDRDGEATTLNNIGEVWRALGEPRKALDYFERALPLLRAVGDRAVEVVTSYNAALAYRSVGDLDQAIAYLERCVLVDEHVDGLNREKHRRMLEQVLRERDAGLNGTDPDTAYEQLFEEFMAVTSSEQMRQFAMRVPFSVLDALETVVEQLFPFLSPDRAEDVRARLDALQGIRRDGV